MPDETSRRYLFVAIDCATRWVFVQIKIRKTAAARTFLNALLKTCPPKTDSMVERFNGRIADVLKTHRLINGEEPEQTLPRYVAL